MFRFMFIFKLTVFFSRCAAGSVLCVKSPVGRLTYSGPFTSMDPETDYTVKCSPLILPVLNADESAPYHNPRRTVKLVEGGTSQSMDPEQHHTLTLPN